MLLLTFLFFSRHIYLPSLHAVISFAAFSLVPYPLLPGASNGATARIGNLCLQWFKTKTERAPVGSRQLRQYHDSGLLLGMLDPCLTARN